VIKARVTFRRDRREWFARNRWEVWEDHGPGTPSRHHSFHRTEAEAKATAAAQNRINKREAAKAAAEASRQITGGQFDDAY
jgi:hypothetical protein